MVGKERVASSDENSVNGKDVHLSHQVQELPAAEARLCKENPETVEGMAHLESATESNQEAQEQQCNNDTKVLERLFGLPTEVH